MNSVDFCYWLQGYFELSDAQKLTPKQVEIIKNHLNLVFRHEIDPMYSSDTVEQQTLNQIHVGQAFALPADSVPPHLRPQLTEPNKPIMRC